MNLLLVVLIGVVLGALDGVGVLFAPEEPYKWQILFAATLKGMPVALLTGLSLSESSHWWTALAAGAFYGFAFALVIFLAQGRPEIRRRALHYPKRDRDRSVDWPIIGIWAVRTDRGSST